MTTICKNCVFRDLNYISLCLASPREVQSISLVSGKLSYVKGGNHENPALSDYNDNPYEYCSHVNDGNCKKFKQKGFLHTLWQWIRTTPETGGY